MIISGLKHVCPNCGSDLGEYEHYGKITDAENDVIFVSVICHSCYKHLRVSVPMKRLDITKIFDDDEIKSEIQ